MTPAKRILVRVINHQRKLDEHLMVIAEDNQTAIAVSATAAFQQLALANRCALAVNIPEMLVAAQDMNGVRHATYFDDGWLIQLRVDCATGKISVNDNEAPVKKAI